MVGAPVMREDPAAAAQPLGETDAMSWLARERQRTEREQAVCVYTTLVYQGGMYQSTPGSYYARRSTPSSFLNKNKSGTLFSLFQLIMRLFLLDTCTFSAPFA